MTSFHTLDEVLTTQALEPIFQPISDLETGEVVAYEALMRGPEGPLSSPLALLDAAAEAGQLAELDWLARVSAYRSFLAAGGGKDLVLFVNFEPETLHVPCPPQLLDTVLEASKSLRVMVELTERSLADRPASVLTAMRRARDMGWAVALDDVGAAPESLALLPVVEPEVIKLDLRLIQSHKESDVAGIVAAVRAEAERTGARILAEGIETERHLQIARAAGATLGQGWLIGHPGPLPSPLLSPSSPLLFPHRPALPQSTPFEVVSATRPLHVAPKDLLLPTSHHIEALAEGSPGGLLLACFQHAENFTPATRLRYERLLPFTTLTAALGVGMSQDPFPGVRGGTFSSNSALAGEWNVILVTPHVSAALVALDMGDTGPDMERRFEYTVTYDRTLVLQAARSLLAYIAPLEA